MSWASDDKGEFPLGAPGQAKAGRGRFQGQAQLGQAPGGDGHRVFGHDVVHHGLGHAVLRHDEGVQRHQAESHRDGVKGARDAFALHQRGDVAVHGLGQRFHRGSVRCARFD